MSIASMTGFAREAGVTGPYQWAWELKTVNGRGLEVRVRAPSGLDAVGEEARGQILKALTRGQGQLNLSLSRSRPQRPSCASTRMCCNRSWPPSASSSCRDSVESGVPRRPARRARRRRDGGRGRRSGTGRGAGGALQGRRRAR